MTRSALALTWFRNTVAGGGLIAAAATAVAPLAQAQRAAMLSVRVFVVDSAGIAVAGADVGVVRGLRESLASARSDESGGATLRVPLDTGEYHLVVRKIGYRRTEQFFFAAGRDLLALRIRLLRTIQQLATVKVEERESTQRRAYFIDADAIANSGRQLYSGIDIIEKLRPDMIWGLGGRKVCPKLSNVFVNGTLVRDAPPEAIERADFRAPETGRRNAMSGRTMSSTINKLTGLPAAILLSIRPEHIAELRYNDCFETQVKVNNGANAAFVVLKPGIGYSQDFGSYVLEDPSAVARAEAAAAKRAARRASGAASRASTAEPPEPPLPAYRARLLGVFDDESGAPIEGAEVIDIISGSKMLTSPTGTVALVFVPDGGGDVRVEKAGYKPLTITVLISPRDTVPLTLTLSKRN